MTPMSYVVEGNRILFRTKPGKRYEASGEILTASAGVAAYEGVQMWRGTPGDASWDPEPTQEERDARTTVEEPDG